MLVIRFNRVGKRNHAQYRIVVQEKKRSPSGKHIAIVGSYDPHMKTAILKENEIKRYLADGAQPSDRVYNLLIEKGVISGKKRIIKIPKKKPEKSGEEKTEKIEDKTQSFNEPKSGENLTDSKEKMQKKDDVSVSTKQKNTDKKS